MSIPRKVMIPCPECGEKYQITIFDSLNTDYTPNLPDSIINGTWFLAKCPFCGSLSPMEYDFLYHDLKHNAMIWVVHTNNDSYYKTMSDIRATPVFPGLLTRIVSDMWSLREKVSCLESGKDDRVIEIYKVLLNCNLKEKSPDFHLTKTIYTIYQGKPTFFFYNEMDKRLSSPFQEEIYQHLLKTLNVLWKQEDNQPYPIYDQHWAEEYFQHLVSSNTEPHTNVQERSTTRIVTKSSPSQEYDEKKSPIAFCRKCGARLLSDSLFCSYCGTKVISQ